MTKVLLMTFIGLVVAMLLAQHALSAPVAPKEAVNTISICIANCAQCHDILGDVFEHRKCSRDCVRNRGTIIPDCTSPIAIKKYLILSTLGEMLSS
ncbi:hypothetical protein RvY_13711 [Ramazzottius varieornatus]|uniref:Eclosion hormone n=1 Tax=Ramazzottius varieornatus TaxID=947166 RepID=A0A1D1VSW4_RAMVA|nr:hypothetical protein RvY_13711 [Ramazzottius varieornatus]